MVDNNTYCANIFSYSIMSHVVDFMKTLTLMEATLEAENEVGMKAFYRLIAC